MRIRRRAPPPPPPPSQGPDLSSQLPALPKGREEARKEEKRRSGKEEGGGERVGLHPDGDLPIEPHHGSGVQSWRSSSMDPSPSDPPQPMGATSHHNGWCIPPSNPSLVLGSQEVEEEVKKPELGVEVDSKDEMRSAQVNSNKRSGSNSGAQVSEAIGSCTEGEKAYPLKKTRGGYDNWNGVDGSKERKAKAKARASATTAPNTNCSSTGSSTDKKSDELLMKEEERVGIGGGKKRRSPAVLMEGSRCSRVNGRGWRCCQQTLVGYSLCEHHLGKGRLRSMSSVRGQLGTSKPMISSAQTGDRSKVSTLQQEPHQLLENGGEDDEKQVKRKRKKIGMVKARSISSLLDETNQSVASVLPPFEPPAPPPPTQAPEATVEPPDAIKAMV